eukprot:TRINITY_DN2157_c0_g1_i1.p1 TRINITY_DN2157_c0_g1~~TRINITY_DN2157_c0_g1_i1.p1  ORF type:complete len:808 (-),score=203.60 TRINITY_DN2157_c0_g1_i1:79-2502(-)
MQLAILRDTFPTIPILALTATATAAVQQDIMQNLKLRDPLIAKTTFNRTNLSYALQPKSAEKYSDLVATLKDPTFAGPSIVYCQTRKESEKIAEVLRSAGFLAAAYHADLPTTERSRVHHEFIRDKLSIVVATVAFGMGIDKPDIRRVLHYGAPTTIEGYYQQTGRAGRDGQPSQCIMFYGAQDFVKQAQIIGDSSRNHELLSKLRRFVYSTNCRRFDLLEYFGEQYPNQCTSCDNCISRASGMSQTRDFAPDARLLLTAIRQTGGSFGFGVPIDVLMGSKSKKVVQRNFEKLACYGTGRLHNNAWWQSLARMLLTQNDFLVEKVVEGYKGAKVYSLGRSGVLFLAQQSAILMMTVPADMVALEKTVSQSATAGSAASTRTVTAAADSPLSPVEQRLYVELSSLRTAVASEKGIPPYMVFANKVLERLATIRPSSTATLLNIDGIGQVKADSFGARFLAAIAQFCQANSLALDAMDQVAAASQPTSQHTPLKSSATNTHARRLHILVNTPSLSITAAAQADGIKETSYLGSVATAATDSPENAALFLQIWSRLGVPDAVVDLVCGAIESLDGATYPLAPLKASVGDAVSWDQLKLVVAKYCIEHGNVGASQAAVIASQPAAKGGLGAAKRGGGLTAFASGPTSTAASAPPAADSFVASQSSGAAAPAARKLPWISGSVRSVSSPYPAAVTAVPKPSPLLPPSTANFASTAQSSYLSPAAVAMATMHQAVHVAVEKRPLAAAALPAAKKPCLEYGSLLQFVGSQKENGATMAAMCEHFGVSSRLCEPLLEAAELDCVLYRRGDVYCTL